MAAIDHRPYYHLGLSTKPTANMNKYQDVSIDFIEEDMLMHNVSMFRRINGL